MVKTYWQAKWINISLMQQGVCLFYMGILPWSPKQKPQPVTLNDPFSESLNSSWKVDSPSLQANSLLSEPPVQLFPSSGDLPDPGIEPRFPALQVESLTRSSQVAIVVKHAPANAGERHKRHGFDCWVGKILWRRAWQPIPVFFSGKSHGERSLVGYSPWGLGHYWSDLTYTHDGSNFKTFFL